MSSLPISAFQNCDISRAYILHLK